VAVPEAVEPFMPVPSVSEDGDLRTVHLRLTVSGEEETILRPPEITVQGGAETHSHCRSGCPVADRSGRGRFGNIDADRPAQTNPSDGEW
jgi:hypothetical protein